MDRIRRNERLAAMTRILVESPNKIFTLGTFCEMFGAAKSTLSEDIDILRGVFAQFHLGQLDTVTGAAGGVRYRPVLAPEDAYRTVKDLAQMLARAGARSAGRFHLYGRYSGDAGRGGADGHDHCLSILPRGTGFRPDDGDEGHSDCDDDGRGHWACRRSLCAETARFTKARR